MCEVIIALFILSVQYARAEACETTSAGRAATTAKTITPASTVFAFGEVLCVAVPAAASDNAHPLDGNGLHACLGMLHLYNGRSSTVVVVTLFEDDLLEEQGNQ